MVKAHSLSDLEVCLRWHRLYTGTLLARKYARGDVLSEIERLAVKIKLDEWRLELANISQFVWALNGPIARMANAEDKCTDRFWESRFKSQALLDEKALVACMACVDRNPIRPKMAKTLEDSDHTSIKKRIDQLKNKRDQPLNLAKFVGKPREPMPQGLPFDFKDYLSLVDITGRAIREDKRGHIENAFAPILYRLDISSHEWLTLKTQFESRFKSLVGCTRKLKAAAENLGY